MRLLQLQMAAQSHLGEQSTALHGTSLSLFSLPGAAAAAAVTAASAAEQGWVGRK